MRLSRPIPEFLQISAESAYIGSMNAATISELFLVAACGLSGRACRKIPRTRRPSRAGQLSNRRPNSLAGALRYGGLHKHHRRSPLAQSARRNWLFLHSVDVFSRSDIPRNPRVWLHSHRGN